VRRGAELKVGLDRQRLLGRLRLVAIVVMAYQSKEPKVHIGDLPLLLECS